MLPHQRWHGMIARHEAIAVSEKGNTQPCSQKQKDNNSQMFLQEPSPVRFLLLFFPVPPQQLDTKTDQKEEQWDKRRYADAVQKRKISLEPEEDQGSDQKPKDAVERRAQPPAHTALSPFLTVRIFVVTAEDHLSNRCLKDRSDSDIHRLADKLA